MIGSTGQLCVIPVSLELLELLESAIPRMQLIAVRCMKPRPGSKVQILIGASLSKPYTRELAGEMSVMCGRHTSLYWKL